MALGEDLLQGRATLMAAAKRRGQGGRCFLKAWASVSAPSLGTGPRFRGGDVDWGSSCTAVDTPFLTPLTALSQTRASFLALPKTIETCRRCRCALHLMKREGNCELSMLLQVEGDAAGGLPCLGP